MTLIGRTRLTERKNLDRPKRPPVQKYPRLGLGMTAAKALVGAPSPAMHEALPAVVFGSTGFIGAQVSRWLSAAGYRVFGLSSRVCNLTNRTAVARAMHDLPRGTRLVMCATINRTVEDSFRALTTNLQMVENMVREAPPGVLGGIIFFSSVDVYGLVPPLPIDETTPLNPASYYGIGKLASESLLCRPGALDCPLTVLRCPGIYGPGDRQRSILGAFLHKILEEEPLTLYGDGSVLRDYVEVEDVCRIVERFAQTPVDGVFNLARGQSLPLSQWIEALAAAAGRPARIETRPPNGISAGDLIFDVTALESALPGLTFAGPDIGAARYLSSLVAGAKAGSTIEAWPTRSGFPVTSAE